MKISKEELENLSDKTISEIAEIYGCTKQNISLWLKKYGLERRSLEIKPERKILSLPVPPKEELEALANLKLDDVSAIYNVSPRTVVKWYECFGIQRPGSHKKTKRMPTKEELENLSDMTYIQISEKYRVPLTTVFHWFKYYGLNRNGNKRMNNEPIEPVKAIEPVKVIEEPPIKQMRLDLVSKILNGNAEFLSAIKTLLERK